MIRTPSGFRFDVAPGDSFMSLLPLLLKWHRIIDERTNDTPGALNKRRRDRCIVVADPLGWKRSLTAHLRQRDKLTSRRLVLIGQRQERDHLRGLSLDGGADGEATDSFGVGAIDSGDVQGRASPAQTWCFPTTADVQAVGHDRC